MKVLHILDSLNRGGAEMLALDVCGNAEKNGIDLMFAATGGGTLEDDFKNSGVSFFRLNRRFPIDFFVIRKLRQIIKNHQIEIVHTHQAVAGIHAYFATLGTNVRNVLSFPGYYSDAKNRQITKFLVPRMAANIPCSNGLLHWLSNDENLDISQNFQVIYNGVDTKRLEYSGENLKTELKVAANSQLFGMVSHFYAAPRKDQITLCKAFAKVAGKLPDWHLILVGKTEPGAEAKYAECVKICQEHNLIDRVHFLGQRDDLAKVVSSLDVYVFSSLHEGLPIALMEAMLARRACILSDIPPHLEVSNNGETAEIFKTQDADDLANKLLKIAENRDFRKDLAQKAKLFADRTFSIEAHLKSLRELYESII